MGNLDEDVNRLYALKQMFIDGVTQLDGVQINGLTGRESAPHVISVSFRGIPERGSAACAGGAGNLCFFGKRMFFQ